jgi:hypothetical protein
MSKVGSHDPFGFLKHKLWPKEGSGVKLAVWFPTTKSWESLWFPCVQGRATYRWKDLDKGYIFVVNLRSKWGLKRSYGPPKSWESQFWKFRDSNLGVQGQNDIWMLALWPCTKNTIRGKVLVSLKSGPRWILWIRVCPWLVRAPNVLQLCTNQLVVWFVQVRVSNWLACHFS